ncbi:MAG: FKBP-type peptidyl-prolyl cis-trans isomerase [Nitrospirae bacterium]|nr:FKBP-type peptidyl-prolyl cis-trans isomerase [Nitrospirota bacterium]
MATVKQGDTIRIHYTGRLEDGTIFDSSEGGKPLEFTVGSGEIIPGLEEGVIGMASGESKTITIPAEQAYGHHMKERVFELDRKRVPDGVPVTSAIVGISESSLTMDCNHPLAGKTLIFDTTLVEIV